MEQKNSPHNDPHDTKFVVRVWFDERDGGQTFGTFQKRDSAEECLKVLASRIDIQKAEIQEVE